MARATYWIAPILLGYIPRKRVAGVKPAPVSLLDPQHRVLLQLAVGLQRGVRAAALGEPEVVRRHLWQPGGFSHPAARDFQVDLQCDVPRPIDAGSGGATRPRRRHRDE